MIYPKWDTFLTNIVFIRISSVYFAMSSDISKAISVFNLEELIISYFPKKSFKS